MLLPHIPVSLCSCRTAGGIILVLVMVTARVTDQVTFCIHVIVSLANGAVYVWYPPSFTLTTSGEGLCERRWEGGKGVEGQNVSQVCQVILAFSACGNDVAIRARWQIPYRPNSLPYGRSFIVSWAGTRYAHTQGLGAMVTMVGSRGWLKLGCPSPVPFPKNTEYLRLSPGCFPAELQRGRRKTLGLGWRFSSFLSSYPT